MNRTTLFACTAAVALIGLGMIVVQSAGASTSVGATPTVAAGAAAAPTATTPAGTVPNAASAASAKPLRLPSGFARSAPAPGALPAQMMTGATRVAPPGWIQVAPEPALVAPPPTAAPGAFPMTNNPPPSAGFGFAPQLAPPPPAQPLAQPSDVASQVGSGPSQARASAVGPENEMATRAQRSTLVDSAAAAQAAGPGEVATTATPGSQPAKDPLAGWGPPPAPEVDPRRFTEAHWQGLEVVPRTPGLAKALKLPPGVPGVVVDDVTLPADLQGFQAGDLVTHVGQLPTPDLTSFIRATDVLRDQRVAQIDLLRDKQPVSTMLTALMQRLGTANGETPSMIPPGARMPHEFRGPCTNCHRIGTTGTLAVDQGDMMTTTAPTIRVGARRPHRDRGPCLACHTVTP